jgi:hypothetical protein
MLEVNFGMKDSNLKKQSKKPMPLGSLEKMLVEVVMILMFIHMVVLEHIFVEKNLL